MPLLLVGLVVAYLLVSQPQAKPSTAGQPGAPDFVGPPAPVSSAAPAAKAPAGNFAGSPTVQSGRFIVQTEGGRYDQPYVESLFTAASVDGWYVGPANGATGVIVELQDVNLNAAWTRLLTAPGVTFVDTYSGL